MAFSDLVEQIRKQPKIEGVCGYPTPRGVFVDLVYRCWRCQTERIDVVPMIVGGSTEVGKLGCLTAKCHGAFTLTLDRVEFRSI